MRLYEGRRDCKQEQEKNNIITPAAGDKHRRDHHKKKDGDLNSLRNKVSLKFEGMNEVFSQSFYWFLDVF